MTTQCTSPSTVVEGPAMTEPTLSVRDEDRLRGFPAHFRKLALISISRGKAFCPSCHWAGHSNCAHFDECDAFIEPS